MEKTIRVQHDRSVRCRTGEFICISSTVAHSDSETCGAFAICQVGPRVSQWYRAFVGFLHITPHQQHMSLRGGWGLKMITGAVCRSFCLQPASALGLLPTSFLTKGLRTRKAFVPAVGGHACRFECSDVLDRLTVSHRQGLWGSVESLGPLCVCMAGT